MKEKIQKLLEKALDKAISKKSLSNKENIEVAESLPQFGDFSSNIAFKLSAKEKKSPQDIAKIILDNFPKDKDIKNIDIAPSGFINFTISNQFYLSKLKHILNNKTFGKSNIGKGKKIILEYLSANPTGPLTAGNSRGGFIGDVLANILQFLGYGITREYYINDYGKQIETLGKSVELRYRESLGKKVKFPKDMYPAQYIIDIVNEIKDKDADKWLKKNIKERTKYFSDFAIDRIVNEIKKTLVQAGVNYDNWFSETSLHKSSFVKKAAEDLIKKKLTYNKGKAIWFKAKEFGDDKDRVIVRSNGEPTYLLSDIAYHRNKFTRRFDKAIDIWGTDHHGYIKRLQSALTAFGFKNRLDIILNQFVNLKENGKEIRMSKRKGTFVTLQEVLDMIGSDAVRFFFISKSNDTHLDLNINLVKEKSQQNPLFYSQYANARINSVLEKINQKELKLDFTKINLESLTSPFERVLIKELISFEDVVLSAGEKYEPYRLIHYLISLATAFHAFYEKERIIIDDKKTRQARVALVIACRNIFKNVFRLIGISAPKKM